ncbi:ATP-binding protein, partial [Streptomyces sp. YIM 98790]|uniref:ATP-binding protein n=1 Tax=Streptomyces sp. YIM 98790 TaxID=2689077 RepID=UPI001FB79C60
PPLAAWLHTPRPAGGPGIWRLGRVPRPPRDPDPIGDRELYGGAALAVIAGLLVWSLYAHSYLPFLIWPLEWLGFGSWGSSTFGTTVLYLWEVLLAGLLVWGFGRAGKLPRLWRRLRPGVLRLLRADPAAGALPRSRTLRGWLAAVAAVTVWRLSWNEVWDFWLEPLYALVPDSWWQDGDTTPYVVAYDLYYLLYAVLLAVVFGALGDWRGVWRTLRGSRGPAAGGDGPGADTASADLTRWEPLRAAGAAGAADLLSEAARSGEMSDLDWTRIDHAWRGVRARPTALGEFGAEVAARGAAAFAHPSGDRDLPARTARHDLLTRQVLIGRAVDDERNPYPERGEGVALEPAVLGTSLLAVGPPGSGKTGRVIRPVTESLCLQALAGQAAVIAVGDAGAGLGPDAAFDIIVRTGSAAPGHRLDLYGGADSTDAAAALLAEALAGGGRTEPAEAAAALAQLLGPYRAAYGHFPGVPELRALLDGAPALLATLREDLAHAGAWDQQRELDARERQAVRPDDVGRLLADRLAVLDRAGFGGPQGGGAGERRTRPFSLLGAVEHPVRARIDLPGAGHAEAARILTRLLLAQFTAAVTARGDRSLFACLVLDDATAAVTEGTVRGLTRLRPANAGAVLALRSLEEVPERLRTGLLGAVGCRMAFSGLTTWDAEQFARVWGTEWREDRDVTSTPDRTGGLLRRSVRGVRKAFTGRDATTETVTVRQVERERWPASELAHRVPPRHAVVSLTSVTGDFGPPLLVHLQP